jgi:hypothetical protein
VKIRGSGPGAVGVGERKLPLERHSVLGEGECLSCCCEGLDSLSLRVRRLGAPSGSLRAAEEPSLFLRHLTVLHFFFYPAFGFLAVEVAAFKFAVNFAPRRRGVTVRIHDD